MNTFAQVQQSVRALEQRISLLEKENKELKNLIKQEQAARKVLENEYSSTEFKKVKDRLDKVERDAKNPALSSLPVRHCKTG